MNLRLSRAALRDLDTIFRQGVLQIGPAQAERYQMGLKAAMKLLTEYPEINRLRTEFSKPFRIHRYSAHLIFYRIDQGDVLVTRVRHGGEDWMDNL
jgi:toxin ParE1/3/4